MKSQLYIPNNFLKTTFLNIKHSYAITKKLFDLEKEEHKSIKYGSIKRNNHTCCLISTLR